MKRLPDGQVFPFNAENFHKPQHGFSYEPVDDVEKDAIANRMVYNANQRRAQQQGYIQPTPPRNTSVMPPFPSANDQPQYAIDQLIPQNRFQFEPTQGFKSPYLAQTATPVPQAAQEFTRQQERDYVPPVQQPVYREPTPMSALRPQDYAHVSAEDALAHEPVSTEAQVLLKESLAHMSMPALTRHAMRLGVGLPQGCDEAQARDTLFHHQYQEMRARNGEARASQPLDVESMPLPMHVKNDWKAWEYTQKVIDEKVANR